MQERVNGYKEAMKDNGIKFRSSWLKKVSYQHITRDLAPELKSLIHPELQVDAFFFATNSLAVESLKVINKLGVRVPEDLAIISFDESDAFDLILSARYLCKPVGRRDRPSGRRITHGRGLADRERQIFAGGSGSKTGGPQQLREKD